MEDIIFQIYGTFVLTLAGFVLPVLVVAISAFPEGVKLLRRTYENEENQAKQNLEDEIHKQKSHSGDDYDILAKNIKTLQSVRKKAQKRLLYLSPQYILSKSVIAVGVCLVSFLLGIYFYNHIVYVPVFFFILSLASLIWTLVILSNSIEIIIEASTEVQGIRRATEEKSLELLTVLADNSKREDGSLFIEQNDIHVIFRGEEVIPQKEYTFSVNNKHSVKIALKNLSEYMLKTAELGFTFPAESLVEGTTISNVYTGDKEKIIRFKYDHLQSNVNHTVGTVSITFLKIGVFSVDTFVKGENLKNRTIKFKIRVVE